MRVLRKLFVCAFIVFSLTVCINANSEEVFIEYLPQYTYISGFEDNIGIVNDGNGVTKILNTNGKILHEYEDASVVYNNGIFVVTDNGGVHIYNNAFQLIYTCSGIGAKNPCDNKVGIKNQDLKQALYDYSGNRLLEEDYTDIVYGEGNYVLVNDGNDSRIVDIHTGNVIISQITDYKRVSDNSIICCQNGLYGVIGFDGNIIIDFKYDTIHEGANDYYNCFRRTSVVIYTEDGFMVNEIDTSDLGLIGHTNDDYIPVCDLMGKWSYVNISNNKTIAVDTELQADRCYPFYDGYAVVCGDGEYTYISSDGLRATDKSWDMAYRFSEGYAIVMNTVYDNASDMYYDQWQIIDEYFEVVKEIEYDVFIEPYSSSTDFSNGYIRTIDRDTNLMGFICLEDMNFDPVEEETVYTISGSITSYGSSTETVNIRLLDEYENLIESKSFTTSYMFTVNEPGKYILEVSKQNHVTRRYMVVIDD